MARSGRRPDSRDVQPQFGELTKMTKSDWRNIAELIGISAIVASLVFVSVQLGQDRRAALSGVSQSSASSHTELQIAIADNAEILAKSNRGDELSEADMIVMNALVAAMHRQVVTDTLERRRLGASGETVTWLFASWLIENPGAREVWIMQRERLLQSSEQGLPDGALIQAYTNEVRTVLDKLEKSRR